MDTDWWFPFYTRHGMTIPKREDMAHAIAICKQCPVKADCLDDAIDGKLEHGIYGGLTPRQRRRLKRWPAERNYGFRAK